MSINLYPSGVNVATSGSFEANTQDIQFSQVGWVDFLNESPFTLTVAMGGMQFIIPAWTEYPVQVQAQKDSYWQGIKSYDFPIKISPILIGNQLNTSTLLFIVLYNTGETPAITNPTALVRQVSSLITNAQAITNTGFPPATPVIFAEPVGDSSAEGALNFNNQGQGTLGDSSYNGSLVLSGPDTASLVLQRNLIQFFDTSGNLRAQLMSSKQTLNGGTGGTAQIFMLSGGDIKIVYVLLTAFQSGASNQSIALPVNFMSGAQVWTGGIGPSTDNAGIGFSAGGVLQTVRILTALALGGGTVGQNANNFLYQNSHGTLITGFDSLVFQGGETAAHTGDMTIIGN